MSGSNIELISDHIEAHVGKIEGILHELMSPMVHVDIHVVGPTRERPFRTLVTSGMSDLPMAGPNGQADLRFCELMLCLPESWPMAKEAWKNEENYWPIRWLKILSRFPHEYKTCLWFGHTIPNGDPPAPLATNTAMQCMMLAMPMTVSTKFWKLRVNEDKEIYFFSILPLFGDEVELKLKKGAEELLNRFEKAKYSEIINVSRKSVASNSWWKFF